MLITFASKKFEKLHISLAFMYTRHANMNKFTFCTEQAREK